MKKFVCNSLILMSALLILLCQTALAADFSNLRILHTNDSHGYDIYGDGHNGMAVIGELKQDLEKQGFDVILLSAGDFSQDNNLVNYSKGKAAIDIFNAVKYDAATLGNHEFDYGQDVLARNIKMAKFPIISSNIVVEATGELFVPPHVIIQKGDVKIGVFGLATPSTIVSSNPKNLTGLKFLELDEMYAACRQQVRELKEAGCDLIIALGHLGSEAGYMGNRSEDVLANVDGIDIFIDGHDHQVKNNYINGALLTETGYYTQNIGNVLYKDGKWVEELIPFGTYTTQDPKVKKVIDKAEAEMEKGMSKVIGESQVTLDASRDPGVRTKEMNSADFVADAYLWQARQANVLDGNVDIAVLNGGGIRDSIPAGKVTSGTIVSVQPYNNQLFVIKITGEKLLEIMEAATCVAPKAIGAFPQVAGMKYTLDTTVPFEKGAQYENSLYYAPAKPGSRVTIESIGDKPFDLKAEYVMTTTEFVVNGGDAYGGLAMPGAVLDKHGIGYMDAEAVENYIKEGLGGVIGEEYAEPQGRITIK